MIDFRKVKDIKDLRNELWISIKHWWNLGQKYKDVEVDKKSFMYGFYIGRHDSYLDIWKGLNSENTEGVSDGLEKSGGLHDVSLATRSDESHDISEPSVEGALASTTHDENRNPCTSKQMEMAKCYKYKQICKYNCQGLCKDSM